MQDLTLVKKAQSGDQQAATLLYNKYKHYGYYCVRNAIKVWTVDARELRDDIVSDAFVEALRTYDSDSGAGFGSWYAWQIRGCVAKAMSYRMAQRRKGEECDISTVMDYLPAPETVDIDVTAIWDVFYDLRLNPRHRTAYELLYRCGYSIKTVATLLGVTRQAIDSIVKSINKQIIANLGKKTNIVIKN